MPRPTVPVTVRQQTFQFERQLLDDFPDAPTFLGHLLDLGRVASHVAAHYVKLVGRLKRQGRLVDVTQIHNRAERTAANAYVKWRAATYATLAPAVAHVLPGVYVKRVRYLRRHSISPPAAGKMIPIPQMPVSVDISEFAPATGAPHLSVVESGAIDVPSREISVPPAPPIAWQAAEQSWTLHVPHEFVAPHVDPCESCSAFVLDNAQLEAIAVAFERTWGHRDINVLPPEAYLFGTPPSESDEEAARKGGEKALAIVSAASTRADDMDRIAVPVMLDVESAIKKFASVEGVYISRAACGNRLNEVLGGLWNAWGGG
jgi:hypothetical protein